jgi:uncharacterized protein YjiS (DUF1127 family)
MAIGKLFRTWRRPQLHRQLLEFDDHLLDDLGCQRRRLLEAADQQFPTVSERLRASRPGASSCSIASRDTP